MRLCQSRKAKKKRIEIVTAILEVIIEHCVKLNTMPKSESLAHWKQEIATHLIRLRFIKLPSGKNIDTETMNKYIADTTTFDDIHFTKEILSADYNKELTISNGLETMIYNFISDEYQNLLFVKGYSYKDIYKSRYLKQIQRSL